VKPRRSPLRSALDQLKQDFVDSVLRTIRSTLGISDGAQRIAAPASVGSGGRGARPQRERDRPNAPARSRAERAGARPARAAKRASRRHDEAPSHDADDAFSMAITDPAAVLRAFDGAAAPPDASQPAEAAAAPAPAPLPPVTVIPTPRRVESRTRTRRAPSLGATAPVVPEAPVVERRPVVRPGEEVLRAAGGSVVLKRRRSV
jgi:hypothetical protein